MRDYERTIAFTTTWVRLMCRFFIFWPTMGVIFLTLVLLFLLFCLSVSGTNDTLDDIVVFNVTSFPSTNETLAQFDFNATVIVYPNGTFFNQTIVDEKLDGFRSPLGPTESAFILVGAFVVFAGAAYAAMIIWRRYLQLRYGNSDVLITDDVYDITDLRNFEI